MIWPYPSHFFRLRFLAVLILVLFPAIPWASLLVRDPGPEKNEPMIMENADRFEGYRSRGEYVLSGHVRFRHGTLRLETERAVWLKDRNIVYCESGIRIVQRGAVLTADRGNYDKNLGEASAEGHVFMHDSSGNVEASGPSVIYKRYKHLTTMTGNPELRRFYVHEDNSDSVGKLSASPIGKLATKQADKVSGRRDTLSIRGEVMTYNDSTQVAVADGKVFINRDKMRITCKQAEYHDAADSLFLLGEPIVVVDENQIKGTSMRMGMHGEYIHSLLVKGSAQAHSVEPATDTSSARQSDITGDSLFMAFKEKAIDSVQVFKNATGTYFDLDKPDYVNKMSGEYMVLRFVAKQVTSANVLGRAKSTYYHFEEKRLKGRNEAEGDTIDFAFKQGKVDEVMVKGQAKGTYFGEKPNKIKADSSVVKGTVPKPELVQPKTDQAPIPAQPTTVPPRAAPEPTTSSPASGQPTQPSKPWRKR